MVPVGEDLGLQRQIGSSGIDQIDTRQAVLQRDFLGAQVLFHGQGIVGAAFYGGIVGHDHYLATVDNPDAGD